MVGFHPSSGGPAVYGVIRDDGSYAMNTGREPGLPAGDYQVSVTANELPERPSTSQGGPPPPGKPITPSWYSSKKTSGLSVKVQPGYNELNLELTTQRTRE
jgi:hypothetical protein